jgi:hypothetical protein
MPAASATPRLCDEQLAELLDLIGGADSVELELTVPDSGHYEAARALGMDPLDGQIRQVYFFDTPALDLNRAGVVMRARRVQRKGGDSVVKLRPVVPAEIPTKRRRDAAFTVEVDAMPGGYVCSGTLKRSVENAHVGEAVVGERPLDELFSKSQLAFLSDHAPEGLGLGSLSGARPDSRPEAEVRARGVRAPARRRAVAVPGRLARPRAVDEVPAGRGVPGRGGVEGVSRETRRRPRGRAGDEDREGARVLRGRDQARTSSRSGRRRLLTISETTVTR